MIRFSSRLRLGLAALLLVTSTSVAPARAIESANPGEQPFPRAGLANPGGDAAKTVNVLTAPPGAVVTYSITIPNPSLTPTTILVSDTLPLSLTLTALNATTGSYGYAAGVVTWTGTLSPSESVEIIYGATVTQTAPLGAVITNAAIISSETDTRTRSATFTVDGQVCNVVKTATPVLLVGPSNSWDSTDVLDPVVIKQGGTYKMWFAGYDGTTYQIGYASSADGVLWSKYGGNPVVTPSGAGWDGASVLAPTVLYESGVYKMWYTGVDSSGLTRIGYATSPDGFVWTKNVDPVLDLGSSGSWEGNDVTGPSVVNEGGTYHMWYAGNDGATLRLGHATSSDGLTWTKDPADPVLDINAAFPGAWDWTQVYGPSVVAHANGYEMWYSGKTLPQAAQTGYATSPDGTQWTRQDKSLGNGSSGTFDSQAADRATVLYENGGYKLWYSAQGATGVYTIGYATAGLCGANSHTVYFPLSVKAVSAACPAYYSDSFDNPLSGWPVASTSTHTFAYTGGEYQILIPNPSDQWAAPLGAKVSDFTAQVTMHRTSGVIGGYGLEFGLSPDSNQFYLVLLDAQFYTVLKYDHGFTTLINRTSSLAIGPGTNLNRLKVVRQGASITLYNNEQLLTTLTDNSFTGPRQLAFAANSPADSPLDARFDDFSLGPACAP